MLFIITFDICMQGPDIRTRVIKISAVFYEMFLLLHNN
jgi:hypothetical protein